MKSASRILPKGKVRNRPSELGKEAGFHLARLCDDAEQSKLTLRARCTTCAFQAGSIPNGCEATVLDAHKCVIENISFMCHEQPGKQCAGWLAMRIKGSTTAPWPFSYTDAT